MVKFLLWLLLFVLCWPLAIAALILYPIVWLLLLPFRRGGMAGGGGSGGQKPDRKADQRSSSGEGGAGTAPLGPNRSDQAPPRARSR